MVMGLCLGNRYCGAVVFVVIETKKKSIRS